jgi:hypothetical protein
MVSRKRRSIRKGIEHLVPALLIILALPLSLLAQTTSITVLKNPAPNRPVGSSLPPFAPLVSSAPSGLGFVQVADYVSRTLFEGPESGVAALVSKLASEGYTAEQATDLDTLFFNGHQIDTKSAAVAPSGGAAVVPTGTHGIYLLALRGYPTLEWLNDLKDRGLELLEALPPSGYLAWAPHSRFSGTADLPDYVRSAIPMDPSLRKVPSPPSPDPSPYRRMAILAYEPAGAPSIQEYLESVGEAVRAISRGNGRVHYQADLTDVDIETLSHFESVYTISVVGPLAPSSERQGMLVLKPTINQTTGVLTLPATCENYGAVLVGKGIANFSNTVLGIIDTGFDNGVLTGAELHPDFSGGALEGAPDPAEGSYADQRTHGTMTASVLVGWQAFGTANASEPVSLYRFAHGLAPTARLIIDRWLACAAVKNLDQSLTSMRSPTVTRPHVINYSNNETLSNSCTYTASSQMLDRSAREDNWLFTVSAGNTPDRTCTGGAANGTAAPANAKNVLAVGATENDTPAWSDPASSVNTCPWSRYPPSTPPNYPPEDARNIPTFSPIKLAGNALKPDLVAPSVRVSGPVTRAPLCVFDPPFDPSIFCNPAIASGTGFNYGYSAGTSFAAPVVAGAAAVVRKWYANVTGNPTASPSPALTKAILINGARDLGGTSSPPTPPGLFHTQNFANHNSVPPPKLKHIWFDPYQGWGMANMDRLLDAGTNHFFREQTPASPLTHGAFWETQLTVVDASKPTRLTLVWTDRRGNVGTPYAAMNNLDLSAWQSPCFPCWSGNRFSSTTGYSLSVSHQSRSTTSSRSSSRPTHIPAAHSSRFGSQVRTSWPTASIPTAQRRGRTSPSLRPMRGDECTD